MIKYVLTKYYYTTKIYSIPFYSKEKAIKALQTIKETYPIGYDPIRPYTGSKSIVKGYSAGNVSYVVEQVGIDDWDYLCSVVESSSV